MPNGKNYLNYGDDFFIGKSDPKSDNFDVLHFAVRDLTTAHIPSNIIVISPFAFQGCQKLDKVEIPENSELRKIGSYAFAGCNSLEQVEIPKTVTIIGNCAFSGCKCLKSIDLCHYCLCSKKIMSQLILK